MKKFVFFIVLTGIFSVSYSQQPFRQSTENRGFSEKQNIITPFGKPASDHQYYCGSNFDNRSIQSQMVQFTPEPGQYLRILILYVRFPDDNLVGDQMNGSAVWWDPSWDKPRNPYTADNKFLDQAERDTSLPFMTKYREYTISDYFSEMSMGKFDVIGDEYSITLPLTSDQYRALGYSCAQINTQAIKMADSIYNIDFSLYNNWSTDGVNWMWSPAGGDNTVDMIVMDYRRVPGYPEDLWFINVGVPASGISDLGLIQNFILDGTLVYAQSGVTCLNLMRNFSRMTMIINHEMCHRYFFGHNELGLMTGAEHSSLTLSPRERLDMGYVTPQVIDFPYPQGSAVYTLGDFTATGDIVLIKLSNPDEDFLITNQQKASKYDGISRGSKECWDINRVQLDPYCPNGKGLFIFHETPPLECSFFKPITIEQADGNYVWYIDRYVPYFIPEFSFVIPLFERTKGNPYGRGEYHQPLDTTGGPSQQEVSDNPCSENPNDYFVTYDWLGDGLDAFNVGYDEQFTPYGNPRSNLCDGSASGLSVKLLSRDSITGSITIKIYFQDDIALQELPPSRPKNLKAVKSIISPSTGEFNPKVTWDANSEPDFDGTSSRRGFYNIYRGISLTCSPDTEPVYELIQVVPAGTQEYIDRSISLFPYGGGPVICNGLYRSLSYKIDATDITKRTSLKSDRAVINGYISRCDDSVLVGLPINEIPLKFSVYNYPNPFNPSTQIRYSLPKNEFVTIRIYDLLGREIAVLVNRKFRTAGYYSVEFDGTDYSSGVYFFVIEAGKTETSAFDYRESKKMLLVK